MTAVADGRILERGYRRYNGRRQGVGHAMRSTVAYTLRHIMGLHRPARYKILPFASLILAFLPAAVFVGAAAFLPAEAIDFIPSYPQYYGYISQVLILYAAIIGPDALCADRHSRSLSLYFSSALTRSTYLVSKGVAVVTALCFATLGPPLVMLLGFTILGRGPDGPLGVAATFGRIATTGLVIAVGYTAIAMGIATLTDRRGFATAGVLFSIPLSGSVGALLVEAFDAPRAFFLTSFVRTQFETVRLIFGQTTFAEFRQFSIGDAWWPVVVAQLIFITGPLAFCVYRYRTGRVTR